MIWVLVIFILFMIFGLYHHYVDYFKEERRKEEERSIRENHITQGLKKVQIEKAREYRKVQEEKAENYKNYIEERRLNDEQIKQTKKYSYKNDQDLESESLEEYQADTYIDLMISRDTETRSMNKK